MAREEKVWEYAIEAGYAPLEDRCIIVKGAAGDLSEKIVRFFETWDVAVASRCARTNSSCFHSSRFGERWNGTSRSLFRMRTLNL